MVSHSTRLSCCCCRRPRYRPPKLSTLLSSLPSSTAFVYCPAKLSHSSQCLAGCNQHCCGGRRGPECVPQGSRAVPGDLFPHCRCCRIGVVCLQRCPWRPAWYSPAIHISRCLSALLCSEEIGAWVKSELQLLGLTLVFWFAARWAAQSVWHGPGNFSGEIRDHATVFKLSDVMQRRHPPRRRCAVPRPRRVTSPAQPVQSASRTP